MRGVQILSVALVVLLGNGLASPLGPTEVGRRETSISGRGRGPITERDEEEPGAPWKRDASRV